MEASASGGESLFSDSFQALDKMSQDGRLGTSQTLSFCTFPITYQYKNDGHWYQSTRRTIELLDYPERGPLDRDSRKCWDGHRIKAVNWSPPFQAPFLQGGLAPGTERKANRYNLRAYVEAAKIFKTLIEDDDAVFETKMKPGTCVIFDNRRILHARRAFGGGDGERWLRGAYVDEDAFKSRLRSLHDQVGGHEPTNLL